MSASFEDREFDVCGLLPTGVTVLEASAGTGKTYTIAALAARYVATGIPLDRLLLVTFTRIATGELRERVRERLLSAERGLAQALTGAAPGDDPVLATLAAGSAEEVRRRRERLARAVAGFDAATIATTHGFCQEVLDGLGIAMGIRPYIDDDLAAGRLVAPFALSVPKGMRWHLVYRSFRTDQRDFAAFRRWIIRAAAGPAARGRPTGRIQRHAG